MSFYTSKIKHFFDKHTTFFTSIIMIVFTIVVLGVSYINVFDVQESSTSGIEFMLSILAISSAAFGFFFLFKTFDQEKKIQFYDNENVLLTSTGDNNYVVLKSVGDRDVPLAPVSANIYLTNIGILCEKKGHGEAILYIPLDSVVNFSMHSNGLLFRYYVTNSQINEAVIFVDDKDEWINVLSSMVTHAPRE